MLINRGVFVRTSHGRFFLKSLMEPNTIWRIEGKGGDAILKRRQVAAILSIALISFLIGTTVDLLTMAKDRGANPFDRVWEAIFELEDRLDSVECDNKTGFVNTPAYDSGWETTGGGEEMVYQIRLTALLYFDPDILQDN